MRIARPPASTAETLDPASSLSAYEYLGALYSRLVKQAPDGSVAPDLATAWTVSPDAKTWTFTLRQGVTFHNGKAFTSADAAYTLKHIIDPKVGSPQAGVLTPFLSASDISTPDAHTLLVKLTSPNSEFAVTLLMNYNCYVIPDEGSGPDHPGRPASAPARSSWCPTPPPGRASCRPASGLLRRQAGAGLDPVHRDRRRGQSPGQRAARRAGGPGLADQPLDYATIRRR